MDTPGDSTETCDIFSKVSVRMCSSRHFLVLLSFENQKRLPSSESYRLYDLLTSLLVSLVQQSSQFIWCYLSLYLFLNEASQSLPTVNIWAMNNPYHLPPEVWERVSLSVRFSPRAALHRSLTSSSRKLFSRYSSSLGHSEHSQRRNREFSRENLQKTGQLFRIPAVCTVTLVSDYWGFPLVIFHFYRNKPAEEKRLFKFTIIFLTGSFQNLTSVIAILYNVLWSDLIPTLNTQRTMTTAPIKCKIEPWIGHSLARYIYWLINICSYKMKIRELTNSWEAIRQ